MVEKPFGPGGHDREHDPHPPTTARAGFASDDSDVFGEVDELDEDGDAWDLPGWVDGLTEEELDAQDEEELERERAAGAAEVARALAALDAAEAGRSRRRTDAPVGEDEHESPAVATAAPAREEDDAWGIDQEIEAGMSWLMDLDGQPAGSDPSPGSWGEPVGAGYQPSTPWRAWAGRLVVVGLIAGACFGGLRIYESFQGGPAHDERPLVTPRSRPEAGPSGPELAAGPEAAGAGSAADPLPAEREPAEPAGADPLTRPMAGRDPYVALTDLGFALGPDPGSPFALAHFDSAGAAFPGPGFAPGEGELAAGSSALPERESREQLLSASDMVILPKMKRPFREASMDDLSMIWTGTTIPLSAIDEPRRLLTPEVGRVRVVLHGGELFDGRLYAVGEQRVWLEMKVNRMALPSWQVDRIEHIETAAGSPSLGEKGSQRYVGLERVRVRTAGGVFYGSLLNREGDSVTLLTEDGARITLHDARVEPAGLSRTRIVDSAPVEASGEAPVRAEAGEQRNGSDTD